MRHLDCFAKQKCARTPSLPTHFRRESRRGSSLEGRIQPLAFNQVLLFFALWIQAGRYSSKRRAGTGKTGQGDGRSSALGASDARARWAAAAAIARPDQLPLSAFADTQNVRDQTSHPSFGIPLFAYPQFISFCLILGSEGGFAK